MKKLMMVIGAVVTLTAAASERVVLLDVHQEEANRDTLSYSYQTLELSPAISYKLVTTVKVTTGNPGARQVKFSTFTNDVAKAEINSIVTKTLSLSALFGTAAYPDGDITLSLIGADATPVGTVFDYLGSTIPQGYLLCNGQAVSRTDYARLFALLGTKYGSGNGSTTFNLPDFNDRVSQGTGTYSVGTSIAAGLPNITGEVGKNGNCGLVDKSGGSTLLSGAFQMGKECTWVSTDQTKQSWGIVFNASWSNSIYGNSTTVQPPAIAVNKIIKY